MANGDLRARTEALIAFIGQEIPSCQIKFKDDPPDTMPWWHRVAHAFGRWFVPAYNTRYTTVIYPHIYLPTDARERFTAAPETYYATLRHEFVHLKDFQRFHVWFAFTYVATLPMIWTMRGYWEMRGYTQNLLCHYEATGQIPDAQIERLGDIFSGRDYFFMALPRRRAIRAALKIREKILSGELKGIYPYADLPGAPD